jgi:superfamily II DNA or RNA helicase
MSALLPLRDYQVKTIAAIHSKWDAGIRRPASVLPTGAGKGSTLGTEVPTPSGLRLWGDLQVGDLVFGSNGEPTEVTAIFDRGVLPVYRVTFSDGASVEVDGEHLWAVRDGLYRRTSRERRVIQTQDLAASDLRMDRGYRWRIPMAGAVERKPADLPIDPYVIGALIANGTLGGGGTTLSTPDRQVAERVAAATSIRQLATPDGACDRYFVHGLVPATKAFGMKVKSGQKRIPRAYLEGSASQRLDLLHGLMDGDGSARDRARRSVNYSTTSPGLAEDVIELVTSLGGTANLKRFDRSHHDKSIEYSLGIVMPSGVPAFWSDRKAHAGTESIRNLQPRRAIVSIERVSDQQIRCITVAAPDHLYLITRHHIVTHNTVVFSHLAEDYLSKNPGKRVLVLSHTDELVNQAADKMRQVAPHRSIGIVKAAQNEVHCEIVSASVQSLRAKSRRDQIRNVGLLIIDECFPAGTLVGDRPIESLKAGDLVPSWDEGTGREVMRPVVALMSKAPLYMVRVTLEDGETFACTPNHPILTTRGWCPAGMLLHDDLVVSFTHDAKAETSARELPELSGGVRFEDSVQGSMGHLSEVGPSVLSGFLSGRSDSKAFIGDDGAHEPGACLAAHEGTQPDAVRGEPGEDEGHACGDRASATDPWRKREAGAGASTEVGGIPRVAHGSDRGAERRRDAVSLQNRYSSSDDEGVRRGGRGVPFLAGSPRVRPAPGREAVCSRVADVQVLERGSDGTYGGVCSDGLVYNIEVAGTHTYLINNGVVVHNCHHSSAKTYKSILRHYGALHDEGPVPADWRSAIHVAGFTATLVRGDKEKLSDVWEDVAIKISIGFMIRSGYLLDVKGKRVEVPNLDLKQVKQSGGDYQEGALGEALVEAFAPEIVAKAYMEHASDRKGIGFAPTVDSAYAFEEAFRIVGLTAETVHGALARDERRAILARLKSGETQFVWSVMALTEGFDEPTVSCAVIARPTKSNGLYQQMVGRVLRPDLSLSPEDRGHALILDVVGISRMHGLQSLVDLSTRDDLPEDLDEDLSLLELEDFILDEPEPETEGTGAEPETWYVGPAETREFDPLGRDSKRTWGLTPDGTYYLSAGTTGYVFLSDSVNGESGTFDVIWCAKEVRPGQKYAAAGMTAHRGLHFEMALAWAEEEATERGGFGTQTLTTKKAKWRNEPATKGQAWKVRQVPGWGSRKLRTKRIDDLPENEVEYYYLDETGEKLTKGMAAEIIDAHSAACVIDPLVQFVRERAKS